MSSNTNTRVSTQTKFKALEIKVPAELQQFTKKFDPVILQVDDTPVPPNNSDYFAEMDITNNVELDNGDKCILDTQFDFRYITNYIIFHIIANYPEMNVKGHPYVTPVSLVGYCLTLCYAHILACDFYYRKPASYAATRFMSDPANKDLFKILLSAHVPTFLADLLLEIAPVADPRRPGLRFIPSLAAYLHLHDFGRTFPPALFYAAHDQLASTRTNMEPAEVLSLFYKKSILISGTQTFHAANYYGRVVNDEVYTNTYVQHFENLFNPLIGRALSARPTYARLPFNVETISGHTNDNIYTALLLSSTGNRNLSTKVYPALSKFTLTDMPKAPLLGSVLASLSGSLLLSHTLEPPTLPTWSGVKPASQFPDKDKFDADPMTTTDFATIHKFLDARDTTGTSQITIPTGLSSLQSWLNLATNNKHTDARTPFKHELFDANDHVTPDVLIFQPYDVSASAIGLTIASGLKIETAEFDGFMVPQPNPFDPLYNTNSQFLNSAIRANLLFPMFSSPTIPTVSYSIIAREPSRSLAQSVMTAIISMAKSVIPRMDNSSIPGINAQDVYGFKFEEGHYSPSSGFNVKAGIDGQLHGYTDPHFHGWSSYRYVHSTKFAKSDSVSFILSFRTIYGTNITLSRARNPSLIIPNN